jgi:hypothetical protein
MDSGNTLMSTERFTKENGSKERNMGRESSSSLVDLPGRVTGKMTSESNGEISSPPLESAANSHPLRSNKKAGLFHLPNFLACEKAPQPIRNSTVLLAAQLEEALTEMLPGFDVLRFYH